MSIAEITGIVEHISASHHQRLKSPLGGLRPNVCCADKEDHTKCVLSYAREGGH